MNPALVLIDMQNDFLLRPGITPSPDVLIQTLVQLLSQLRPTGIPVIHVHTLVKADGSDRMPHWKRNECLACVEGSSGCLPPDALKPEPRDYLVTKQFYSAFESSRLDTILRDEQIDTLIVAGLFTHGCVRSSVLDAYARGYQVIVVADAVASNEPEHAEQSVLWLQDRAATFLVSADILPIFQGGTVTKQVPVAELTSNACINGEWVRDNAARHWIHRNPSDNNEILFHVAMADVLTVQRATQTVKEALTAGAVPPFGDRLQIMQAWANVLMEKKALLVQLMVREIGKPLGDAEEEVDRAILNIRSTARMASERQDSECGQQGIFRTRDQSVGVVALVTPWNNPIAIPVGKIAPALLFGNGVVLKPSLPTTHTTTAIVEALFEAGLPKSLLSVVFGGAETAQQLIRNPDIDAVSFTGSSEAGVQVSALCSHLQKPLQAELGGNNAAILMPDVDLDAVAALIAKSAYGFAGQRCTATRRLIVVRDDYKGVVEQFLGAIEDLVVGDPGDHETGIGPLISREHREQVNAAVEQALTNQGVRLLCGGKEPPEWHQGSWYQPTLIDNVAPQSGIVQKETFGPVVVIQKAGDLTEAMALCNGVPQGLVATLYSEDIQAQQIFARRAEAGILRINPGSFGIHPDAPFGGWKASGIGPPEHGVWDAEFYSRVQVLYGNADIME